MPKNKILIVWSSYYSDLAVKHLEAAMEALESFNLSFDAEEVKAGTYELPLIIQCYQSYSPYQGYLPLGLLLKGETDHYEFIWQHVKDCFTKFAQDEIVIGNGVITAANEELLKQRVLDKSRAKEAAKALHYLLNFKSKLIEHEPKYAK